MDGRQAAINVLLGVFIGICVPIVVTWLLVRTHQLEWAEHSFAIFICCMVCGTIGLAVNLPWSERPSRRASAAVFAEPAVTDFETEASPAGFNRRAGSDHSADGAETSDAQSPRHRREARATPRRFTISRREALRLLGLEWQASADDVRQAYRKLARECHPDQFVVKGDEAVATATVRFKQIKEAYELLEMEFDEADVSESPV